MLVGNQPTEVVFEADTVLSLFQTSHLLGFTKHSRILRKMHPKVDIDPYKLGKRHALDASILGDAGQAAKAIMTK